MANSEQTRLLDKTRIDYTTVDDKVGSRGKAFTYEDSLTAVGNGKFHIILLVLCGWAVSSDAVEVLSVSFLLPVATCDLQLNSTDKGWLSSIVFVGMMLGGYLWGSMADRVGRRSVLMWSLTVNGVGGLLSSLSQTFWLFLLLRFVSGIGVGGSIPVIFSYFVEFQSKSRRGTMISVLATFWMMGNILAAGLAWLVIPRLSLGYFSADFKYNSWRIFVALCTIPSLSSAILFLFMPESPKYLLTMGREDEAKEVLQKIYISNKSTQPFNVTILALSNEELSQKEGQFDSDGNDSDKTKPESNRSAAWQLLNKMLQLFGPQLRRTTCILLLTNFAIAFGYYGLFMWFPEIFNRIEKNGGTLCSPGSVNQTADTNGTSPVCKVDVSNVVYVEAFLTALSNLPGNLLSIALMDRVGRKILLVCSMVVSGLSVFFLLFVRVRWQNVLMSCIFGAVSTIGFNSLDVLQTELFPTDVRSTAFGFQTGILRIGAILGNIIFGVLVDVQCSVPMIAVAVLMCGGGLVSIMLPNTTKVDIH